LDPFWQGSLVLGIPFAAALVTVPEGVLYVSRIEGAADFIPDFVVFFAVCAKPLARLGEGDEPGVESVGWVWGVEAMITRMRRT
jgi:hypothetical protein